MTTQEIMLCQNKTRAELIKLLIKKSDEVVALQFQLKEALRHHPLNARRN
jgi:hypothetical protein